MLMGELINRFEDEGVAMETLMAIGDLTLATQVREAAAQEGITPGVFLTRATRILTNEASEDDWLSLMGAMGRAEDPGLVCLSRMLAFAFRPRGAVHACSHTQA